MIAALLLIAATATATATPTATATATASPKPQAYAAPPRRLVLWHSYRAAEEAGLLASIALFEQRHPDIKVELLAIPYDAFPSKLTAALPTDHGPDLFVFAHERAAGWARDGRLAPLAGDADLLGIEAMTIDGVVQGLPLALKSVALYHNRRLVPRPPATLAELAAIARANTRAGTYGLAYQFTDFYYHAAFLNGFGGALFEEPGHRPRLATPEAERALAFVRDLRGAMPEEPTSTLVAALFREGRAAMAINGPWFAGELGGVDYAVALLPAPLRPFLSVECVLVSRRARQPAAAASLASFLAGRESAVARAVEGRQVVATRSAYDDPRLRGDGFLMAFRAQAERAVLTDSSPQMAAVWEPQKRALVAVMSGVDPAEALAQAQRRAVAVSRPAPATRSAWPYAVAAALVAVAAVVALRRAPRRAERQPAGTVARAYAYVAPAAASLLVLVFVPFAFGVGLSFFHHAGGRFTFVGLQNFADILGSRDYRLSEPMSFWFTLAVTLLWTVVNVALHVGIGLALALLLRDPLLRFKGVYRVLLIVPWAVPNYITALLWKGMFHKQFGAVSHLLIALGIEPVGWFTHFSTAFAANVVTNTWLGFPFMMVVALGALQSIPHELYEAAQVDGASRWDQFVHVTLPLLKPSLLPAVILGSVWTFNMFNVIYLVSGGEPGGATDILVSEAYRWAFQRNEAYGFAAAYSTLIFLVLLGYSALTRRAAREMEPA